MGLYAEETFAHKYFQVTVWMKFKLLSLKIKLSGHAGFWSLLAMQLNCCKG